MPALAVVLVVLTALANAAALVLQRKAAQDSARARGRTTARMRDVTRRPAWIVGLLIFGGAVALQAVALSLASISLVQPVVVMTLPFTLLLGWAVFGGALRRYEWASVAAMTVGLVVMLISLRPTGGDALGAGTTVWVVGSVVTLGGLAAFMIAAERSERPAIRASCYGIAAGIGSGFVAVIFKVTSESFVAGGTVAMLATWQTYLLIPTAPIAFLALQYALRAGRLIASQPGLTLGNPLLACLWGAALLGEDLQEGPWLVGGLAGAALMTVGVFLLARSPLLAAAHEGAPLEAPAGLSADPPGDPAAEPEDEAARPTPAVSPAPTPAPTAERS